MSFLTRFRVRTKLIVGFLFVSLIGALIGILGVSSLSQVNSMSERMYEYETLGLSHTATARADIVSIGRELRSLFLASNSEARENRKRVIAELFVDLEKSIDESAERTLFESTRQQIEQLKLEVAQYKKHVEHIVQEIDKEAYYYESDLTLYIGSEVVPVGDRAEAIIGQIIDGKASAAKDFNDQIGSVFNRSTNWLVLFTVIGVLTGMALGLLLARHLMQQLGAEPVRVRAVANDIAKGDLRTDFDLDSIYPQSVMHSMALMQNSLRQIVNNVRHGTEEMAVGIGQIASGNLDLCERTSGQSANVTETASAIEQISSTLRSNAASSREAIELTGVVRESAINGQEAVEATVSNMQQIKTSSDQIANIINVIDSIAFQTNILALNAAVEAARAGTEGRGFAVVASEVRTLAQRSAGAAQEIKTLIEKSAEIVDAGYVAANQAGETIDKMVDQVNRVTTLVDEISAATLEQSMGVEQVNQAVNQLEEVTQHNAALVEESTAAVGSLSEQADALVRVVSVFQLAEQSTGTLALGHR